MSDHPTRGRRQAVALAYHDANDAPRVVAQGYGELAERIIAEAHRQGIHVHDAPELVGLLMQLDLDEAIPPRLYQVIAELLVWVYEQAPEAAPPPVS
ncbi:Flagellar biosynthetic protein FlhB [Halomonas sp. THAF5a]|uniref:EscU/YscU/HrcU family type III secretion system export apparatus switch protein n=1 Tax=Halomonas sp. THAF5a TaxID=2587844 RepID=UPI001267974A|nr:EscU/YscU/HrcU family type III secretion system export apparatus switch protein [Halomonas sp. THAF5a]QFU00102.1 Flagellar biosynthetic protein FlhB [Halomonas sp. THAF5a]